MYRVILIAAAAAVMSSAALAGDLSSNPPTSTQTCLDVDGSSLPVVCSVPASRLDKRENFCSCPEGHQVKTPVCANGQKPQAENRIFVRARRAAARDGSLMGDSYQGQPMCVAPRRG
jgi:hypothetical protein